jgi:Uma2 family endonuclease
MEAMAVTRSWQLTYEDLQGFPDDGRRHEIIEGEHYVTPSPAVKHQRAVLNLAALLHDYVRQRALGTVLVAPMDVVLSEIDVVEPDVIWVSNERRETLTEANVQGMPDLVVEVLSASTRRTDEITKRKLYERHGALEYWIVGPELERVKVYRRAGEGFAPAVEVAAEAGESLASPLLPEFSVKVADLFA